MTMTANGLAKLLEELGELSQVAAKKLAYFHTDEHPDGAGSLKKRLEDEMGDVTAAMSFVVGQLGLDPDRLMSRAHIKLSMFDAWHADPATVSASFIPNADPEAVAKAEAYCNELVPAAGFANLGIKAGAFVEALNGLCHEHRVQIVSDHALHIMNLLHHEEPIDFPEIQDNT